MDLNHARLVYLLTRHQVQIPRNLLKQIPGGDWLAQLNQGLGSAAAILEVPLSHLTKLYQRGEELGPGSETEARNILAGLIDAELTDKELDLDVKVGLYAALERFMSTNDLVEETETDLSNPGPITDIPKFDTGFVPWDIVTGGMYQGLAIVMARPGTGKTSVMLSMMEAVVRSGHNALFVENEIPQGLMLGRMKAVFKRTQFTPRDRLICGSWAAKDVLDYVREYPNPDRVVFFDGPDVMAGGMENRRFVLEEAYQTLVRVKMLSKAVVVSSQPRRGDERIKLTSTAESWAKAWYADMIAAVEPVYTGEDHKLKIRIVKNRFGPAQERSVTFPYNLADLSWESPGGLDDDDWD